MAEPSDIKIPAFEFGNVPRIDIILQGLAGASKRIASNINRAWGGHARLPEKAARVL
jgi:hypothetical protein